MTLVFKNIAALCFLTVIVGTTNPHANQSSASQKVRRIPAGEGVSLESQLVPGDQVVIAQKLESPPMTTVRQRPATAVSELARFRTQAEAVVLAEMVSVASELTPDGSWIRTKASFRPLEAFKATGAGFGTGGGTATLEYDGGEVRINDVTVRAGNYPPLRVGGRYLLFARQNADRGYWYSAPTLAISSDGKVRFELTDSVVDSPINGISLDDARSILRGRP